MSIWYHSLGGERSLASPCTLGTQPSQPGTGNAAKGEVTSLSDKWRVIGLRL